MHPTIAAKAQSPTPRMASLSLNATPTKMAASQTRAPSAMLVHPKIAAGTRPLAPSSTQIAPKNDTKHYPTSSTKPSSTEEPAYLRNDPGLACLTSQLGRLTAQIRYHDYFKISVADAEEECKRDLAASLAKSLVSSSAEHTGHSGKFHSSQSNSLNQWVKHW